MGQGGTKYLARRPVPVGDAVARGMHESAVWPCGACTHGNIAGPQRIPSLTERLLPAFVETGPERFGCHLRVERCICLGHETRT